MAESILTHLVTNLIKQLAKIAYDEYKVIEGVRDQLKSLDNEMRFMKRFLRNSVGKQKEHGLAWELMCQIKEVAFEAEDIIENCILSIEEQRRKTSTGKVFHSPYYAMKLDGVSENLKSIKTRIEEIYANKEKYGINKGEGCVNRDLEATLHWRRTVVDEKVVGFKDVTQMLLQQLIKGSNRREIISIVGMGGLGKTTIAKRLYSLETIKLHFKNRAWVSVSEDYDIRKVVITILNQMKRQAVDIKRKDTQELKNMLRSHLLKNKYIIILDDVWQEEMWDEIKGCIPDIGNSSRILLTTRNTTVARHASLKEPYFLRFLEEEESWVLFEKKVFGEDRCPPNLKTLGKKIVEKCKRLPLSIVVIGSMLASKEKLEVIWKRTLTDVNVPLGEDVACLEILALSYRNLPLELRPCFLYFATFPEDYEISVRELIALWLAEGFVQRLGRLSLEAVAENYLEVLIDRSLVQAGNRRTDGGIKTCRIHDLVRDLCIKEAKGDNFMWIASRINDCSSSINKFKPRRLSIQQQAQGMTQLGNWDPSSVRSFINFDFRINCINKPFWKTLCSEYKLLRVLDLGESRGIHYEPDFSNLVNLRYLRLFLNSNSIPDSLFDLWNLQMLFIEGARLFNIPLKLLLKLQHLQQLVIGKGGKGHIISGYRKSFLQKKQLQSLKVLSTTHPSNHLESAILNRLCPNLRKLALRGSNNGWSLENYFASLSYLEVLKISESYPDARQNIFKGLHEYNLPTYLTKITLKASKWSEASLSMLCKFPNLSTLKLVDLTHAKLIAEEGSFPKLNTLHLDTIHSGQVRFCYDNIQLQHLHVRKCICDIDKYIFMMSGLKLIDVSCPDPCLERVLHKLEQDNSIRCKLVVH